MREILKEAIAEAYEFCGGSISNKESEKGFKVMSGGIAFQTTIELTVREAEAIDSRVAQLEAVREAAEKLVTTMERVEYTAILKHGTREEFNKAYEGLTAALSEQESTHTLTEDP